MSDQYPEDEDTDGLRNVGLFTAQPFDPADSPRELHHVSKSFGTGRLELQMVQLSATRCSYIAIL
jgi:hypothetical protein